MYYKVAEELLERLQADKTGNRVQVLFATHNEDTVQHIVERCLLHSFGQICRFPVYLIFINIYSTLKTFSKMGTILYFYFKFHNFSSINWSCLYRMNERNMAPDGNSILFGQLMGMRDHISFSLGKII